MDYFIINCPHCDQIIQIFKNELNCKIFRHGVYKDTLKQIDPHLPKYDCDYLYNNGMIFGCGKPFLVELNNNNLEAKECDYSL